MAKVGVKVKSINQSSESDYFKLKTLSSRCNFNIYILLLSRHKKDNKKSRNMNPLKPGVNPGAPEV
jgi:hypothetical protein